MVILKCNSLKIQIYKKMSLSTLTYYGFEIEYRNRLNHRVSGFFQRHPIGRIPEHKKKPDRLYRQSGSKSKFTENYFTGLMFLKMYSSSFSYFFNASGAANALMNKVVFATGVSISPI